MAVTAYSKKCTSCGGNRWEYLKDQKLWRCLYCGAQVERKEEYDGLYTIKNVARQVVLDCAYRKLDQADHNLTECLKMSADYAGTLVASICYKLIAVVSPEQLPGQDKRALLGQLKRDYQTLEQTCGKLGDDETELYASFDSSDAWAALAAVFDTIGDTQRRDYLLTLTQPEQIYSKHTNQSLLRMSLRQGRRELADAILRNRENLDLHAACLTVMQEAPDDQDKAGWLESLIDAGSLGENDGALAEQYLSGSDRPETKARVAAALCRAGQRLDVELVLREAVGNCELPVLQAVLTSLFTRRLYDPEIEQILTFAAAQPDPDRTRAILEIVSGSGQFVSLNLRQIQMFLFNRNWSAEQRLAILEQLRTFHTADKVWESAVGSYLNHGADAPEQRQRLLDGLLAVNPGVSAKDFEQYVLSCVADGQGKCDRIASLLALPSMPIGFFRELPGKYLQNGRDDAQVRPLVFRQLLDCGLSVDGALLLSYVCRSADTDDSKAELLQLAMRNGTVFRSDAASYYLETCPEQFSMQIFSCLFRDNSTISPKALENYVLRCPDVPSSKPRNAGILAERMQVPFGSSRCAVRHLGHSLGCSLAQAYLLTTADDVNLAGAMLSAMTQRGTKLNTELICDGVSKRFGKYLQENKNGLSAQATQLAQQYRLFSKFF